MILFFVKLIYCLYHCGFGKCPIDNPSKVPPQVYHNLFQILLRLQRNLVMHQKSLQAQHCVFHPRILYMYWGQYDFLFWSVWSQLIVGLVKELIEKCHQSQGFQIGDV